MEGLFKINSTIHLYECILAFIVIFYLLCLNMVKAYKKYGVAIFFIFFLFNYMVIISLYLNYVSFITGIDIFYYIKDPNIIKTLIKCKQIILIYMLLFVLFNNFIANFGEKIFKSLDNKNVIKNQILKNMIDNLILFLKKMVLFVMSVEGAQQLFFVNLTFLLTIARHIYITMPS